MPRPQRCRRICSAPQFDSFSSDSNQEQETIVLTLDEYEVIRLVDLEKKTHEQCAAIMDISRTTVTEIYESARGKLARCIVYGQHLLIAGGNYRFCDGSEQMHCGQGHCWRQRRLPQTESRQQNASNRKGADGIMKIAVTYENGQIFQHFGHTEQFKIYEVDEKQIVRAEVVDTHGSGHGALGGFLAQHGVEVLICGGIGGGAQAALAQAGIHLYGGVSGDADEAVQAFLEGRLGYNPNVRCNHHDHGEGHTCGDHGCGSHSCH